MHRFKSIHAAVLGCGLAAVSCLATVPSRGGAPQRVAFKLPDTLGTWQLLEERPLQQTELQILQAHDHWRRAYRCRETRRIVVVTLVAGASGPLASHQPELCLSGNEFSARSDAVLWLDAGHHDQLRIQTFEPRQFERPAVTVAYAWHADGHWRVPTIPRLQLAGHTTLQRILITIQHPCGATEEAHAAVCDFVQLAVDAAELLKS